MRVNISKQFKHNTHIVKALLPILFFLTLAPCASAMNSTEFDKISENISHAQMLANTRQKLATPNKSVFSITSSDSAMPDEEQTREEIDQQARKELDQAFIGAMKDCEGRMGDLVQLNARLIKRSEWIAIGGGTLGVIGTVATCPHCAALLSGIAGLANALQSTFSQNNDTPQVTQARLTNLSNEIKAEVDEYINKLPQAIPGDKDFQKNLLNRSDKLLLLSSSCLIFTNTYKAIGGATGTGAASGAGQ